MYNGNEAPADHKICGVFDGFSHWTWKGMKNWLIHFASKTGADEVMIYEAQFLPKSWLVELAGEGATLPSTKYADKQYYGIKSPFENLPYFCETSPDCVKAGAGPNFQCSNGVCIDQCLGPPGTCTSNKDCTDKFTKMQCPGSSYCNLKSKGGNGYCHYSVPKTNTCAHVCQTDDICKTNVGPASYCNKKVTDTDGCCSVEPKGGKCGQGVPSCTKPTDCGKAGWCNKASGCCHIVPAPGGPGTAPYTGKCLVKNCKTCTSATSKYCSTGGCKTGYKNGPKGKMCIPSPGTHVVEHFGDSEPTSSYCRFNKGTSGCIDPPTTPGDITELSRFLSTSGPVGSYWSEKVGCLGQPNGCVVGTKGGMAAAACPYGMYYDKSTTDCLPHQTSIPPPTPVTGNLPTITLTWYGFVGLAKTNEAAALEYIKTVMNFCNAAKIEKMTFPFILPDKNNCPFMIFDNTGKVTTTGSDKPKLAAGWIQTNVLKSKYRQGLQIGLVVYTAFADSNWECFMQGLSCDPSTKPPGKPACDNTGALGHACSWPHVASFLTGKTKSDSDVATGIDLLTAGVSFLQVDKEECKCGILTSSDNATCANGNCVVKILKAGGVTIPLTVPVGLGGGGDSAKTFPPGMYKAVPEVYWDGGNQFPCDGGAGTYMYGTPACTNWSAHKRFANNPQAYYDNMYTTSGVAGSDFWKPGVGDGKAKNNYWLGRNKFGDMIKNIGTGVKVIPSFSIENLSMCSAPKKMTLVGHDSDKGGGYWECK
jgi:hypothetical protein